MIYTCQSGTWGASGGGSGVTSVIIAGTANQITVTGTCTITSTGTCTLSLPSAIIAPGTLSVTGHTTFEGVTSTGATGTGNLVYSISPALTGNPTVPTQAATDNSTRSASTAYVTTGIANAINAAAGRDLVVAATAAVLPNTPNYANGVSGIGATLTSSTNSVLVVDGYTPVILDRILVKNQASSFQNGIYYVSQLGVGAVTPWILTRAVDYDVPSDINNTIVPVANNGTVNPLTSWIQTATVATVGTDAITFAAFTPNGANIVTSASPGAGIGRYAGGTQTQTSAELSGDCTTSGSNVVTCTKAYNAWQGAFASTAVSGTPTTFYTFSSVPALAAGPGPNACLAIRTAIWGSTATLDSVIVKINGTQVFHSNGLGGGSTGLWIAFNLCNNAAVQNAQSYFITPLMGFFVSLTSTVGSQFTQYNNTPGFGLNAVDNNVDTSSAFTLTIQVTGTGGNAQGVFASLSNSI